MAFNCYMHPRNIYKTRPDFKQLASEFPDFSEYVITDERGRVHVNFKDSKTLRCLTKTLLKRDFGLEITIPENCLIPTVPQRLNYILWIEDLLGLLEGTLCNGTVRGIDIGTGPCCIFPVLGAKKNDWKFLATEAEEESLKWAQKNVADNGLQMKVKIRKVSKEVILKGAVDGEEGRFDFCLCNPPFFHDMEDFLQRRKETVQQDEDVMDVKLNEVIVEGGEVEFVKNMINDSLHLKEKISIYTSMIGKKRSMHPIKKYLKELDINFAFTEFCQGNTMRWGVAWTFARDLKLNSVFRPARRKKPKPMNFLIPKCEKGYSIKTMLRRVLNILNELSIEYEIKNEARLNVLMSIKSDNNTWTHCRRKRREAQRLSQKDSSNDLEADGHKVAPDDSKPSTTAKIVPSRSGAGQSDCGLSEIGEKCSEHLEIDTMDVDVSHTDKGIPKSLVETSLKAEGTAANVGSFMSPKEDGFMCEISSEPYLCDVVEDDAVETTFTERELLSSGNISSKSVSSVNLQSSRELSSVDAGLEDYSRNVGMKRFLEDDNTNCQKRTRTLSSEVPESGLKCISDFEAVPLLFCDLELKRHCDKIMLQLSGEGNCNRDPMSQVMQYLKNNLK